MRSVEFSWLWRLATPLRPEEIFCNNRCTTCPLTTRRTSRKLSRKNSNFEKKCLHYLTSWNISIQVGYLDRRSLLAVNLRRSSDRIRNLIFTWLPDHSLHRIIRWLSKARLYFMASKALATRMRSRSHEKWDSWGVLILWNGVFCQYNNVLFFENLKIC